MILSLTVTVQPREGSLTPLIVVGENSVLDTIEVRRPRQLVAHKKPRLAE
jgi:hypothetical protein